MCLPTPPKRACGRDEKARVWTGIGISIVCHHIRRVTNALREWGNPMSHRTVGTHHDMSTSSRDMLRTMQLKMSHCVTVPRANNTEATHELSVLDYYCRTSVVGNVWTITQVQSFLNLKMFVKLFFAFFVASACICHANRRLHIDRDPHWPSIDYIAELICFHKNEDSNFQHIYVDKSLATDMADRVLHRLSSCLSAGLLTTQWVQVRSWYLLR